MTDSTHPLPRRRFLAGLAVGAGAAGPLLPGVATASANEGRRTVLLLDVAIHLDTFTMTPAPGSAPPVAGFGTSFIVEGALFEGGTLPTGQDIDTSSHESIGTWFCRGHFINTLARPDPHIVSHQDFIFSADLMVPHTIVTSGVEGNADPDAVFYRAVTGGTGDFAGVTGQTIYRSIGTNSRLGGANLRFDFELVHPQRSRRSARRADRRGKRS